MTKGNVYSLILWFALPLIAGDLFQQLYNTVDCIIVGNYVGKEALAAVGSTAPLINSIIGFFTGVAAGGSVVISQFFGAHDISKVRRSIHTMVLCSAIAGIFLIFLGRLSSFFLLRFMSTPDDVFEMAESYLKIYFLGAFFQLIYNVAAGILRALGDSKRPLYFLICSSLVNVVLDIVFVIFLDFGVEGAAYATIISQLVAMALVLILMFTTKECYHLTLKELCVDFPLLNKILKIGVPGGVQKAITAFSNVFVQSYINRFGSSCMAGWACFKKIDPLSVLPLESISTSAATFSGQNYGAGDIARIKKGANASLALGFIWTAVLILIFELFPHALISMFNHESEVLYYGNFFLRVAAPFYIFRVLNQTFTGVLRGLGNTLVPTIIRLFSFVLFRQIYLFIVTKLTDSFAPVSVAYPVGWCLCGLLMSVMYIIQLKKWRSLS